MPVITRPKPDEYFEYYDRYVRHVGDDVFAALEAQARTTPVLLAAIGEERASGHPAPDKWSVKQTIGHMADAERAFAYRALRFARADATPLPGFDQDLWMPAARFDRRPLRELIGEFASVRAATLALAAGLDEAALSFLGTASDHPMAARAALAVIAGHEQHHLELLRARFPGIG